MKRRFFYLSPESKALFSAHGLTNFEALWGARITLVDEPNRDGKGWSEVGVLELGNNDGNLHRFYLKRQLNYNGRRLKNPLQKVPLALREWRNIEALEGAGIATMKVACAARDRVGGSDRALFATFELAGYLDMYAWWRQKHSVDEKIAALKAIGSLAAELHNAKYNHSCFYPKHIYIRETDASDVRMIDLEKSRRIFTRRGAIRDLDTLLRRLDFLSEEEVGQLLSAYRNAAEAGWRDGRLEKALYGQAVIKEAKG